MGLKYKWHITSPPYSSFQLKSDQNGIEIISQHGVRYRGKQLKSDQNGIEIIKVFTRQIPMLKC